LTRAVVEEAKDKSHALRMALPDAMKILLTVWLFASQELEQHQTLDDA
jgi:hypothetical protein